MALVLTAPIVRLEGPVAADIVNYVMNLATIEHHSFMKSAFLDVGVQVGRSCALTTTSRLLQSITVHLTKRPL